MALNRVDVGKSDTLNFRAVLSKAERFICPVFQRRYEWETKEVNDLIEDLFSLVIDVPEGTIENRFFGAIVVSYDAPDHEDGEGETCLVVDGQQRLTTLFLVNFALDLIRKERGFTENLQLSNFFVDQDYELDKNRIKLLPSYFDRRDMNGVLERIGRDESKIQEQDLHADGLNSPGLNLITKNFEHIFEQINSVVEKQENKWDFLKLLQRRILDHSFFSVITVGSDLDPNEVFDRLNRTGRKLESGDLLRNFLIGTSSKKSEEQAKLWKEHWQPFEEKFPDNLFSNFIVPFALSVKPTSSNTKAYEGLKDYFQSKYQSEGEEGSSLLKISVAEMNRHAPLYLALQDKTTTFYNDLRELPVDEVSESKKDQLHMQIDRFLRFEIETAIYPYIFNLVEGIQQSEIDLDDGLLTLELVESYVVRRRIVGVERTGLTFFKNIFNSKLPEDNKLSTQFKRSIEKNANTRFYSNEEIGKYLKGNVDGSSRGIYKKDSQFSRFLLIEYERSKNRMYSSREWQIEHVMPQKLRDNESWDFTPEEHEKWVNKWANLVLVTSTENGILSNKDFQSKRADTENGKNLSSSIASEAFSCSEWNVETLLERAQEIEEFVNKRWIYKGGITPIEKFHSSSESA